MLLLFFSQYTLAATTADIDTWGTMDENPPQITADLTNHTGYTGSNHTFAINVTDDESGIDYVELHYWYPSTAVTIVRMNHTVNDTYQTNITLLTDYSIIYYIFKAVDNLGNYVETSTANVTIYDIMPPNISDVGANPFATTQNHYVNISCTVTDNWDVANVTLNITSTDELYQMDKTGNTYYKNLTFFITGNYQYHIEATDTSGNKAVSDNYNFQIVSGELTGTSSAFSVYVPLSIYQNSSSIVMAKLLNLEDGTPKSGFAQNISFSIIDPNGDYILNNATPYELKSGIYVCNFSVGGTLGQYIVIGTCHYSDGLNFMDAGIFTVKWDIYNNMSRFVERMGDLIFLVNYQGKNITDKVAFQIREEGLRIRSYIPKADQKSFFTELAEIALGKFYELFFYLFVVVGIIVVVGTIYGSRKAKQTAKNISKLPTIIADIVAKNEKERK